MQRSQKAVSLIYLACGAIAWLLFREIIQTAWMLLRLPLPADWIVSPTDIIAFVIGVGVFVFLYKSEKVNTFTNETITELGRVVWPNRKETLASTGVVSVLIGICSIILFAFDMIWGMVVKLFYQ